METVRKQTRTQADPVEGELAAINALGNTSLTAEEVYPFGVRLCDNQTDRDLEYFARADLEQLAELFVGKTGIFDHSWSAKDQRARIYRTELVEEPGVVTEAGEPGCYLKGYAYMLRTAENAGLIAEIEGGIKKEVSVSCAVRRQVCSICGHDIHDRGQCSHGKGQVYGEKRCIVRLAEPTDAFEWSFVAVPAQPRAGVVKGFQPGTTLQQALRDHAASAAQDRKERIAVVPGGAGETVTQLTTRAASLNSERVVLVAPGETAQDGGARVAAALAGAICGEADPARPFGGAALQGIGSLATRYSESEVDTLLQGGVTPVELVGGVCSVIRGVTTRTKTGEAADATWRELTTILVVDDVIPSIRAALGAKFARAKNTAQTRGAVRSQVILELEGKVAAEIISGYGEVTAQALESDPTVCLVTFSFTVAQGLNQIWLSAQITV